MRYLIPLLILLTGCENHYALQDHADLSVFHAEVSVTAHANRTVRICWRPKGKKECEADCRTVDFDSVQPELTPEGEK